MRIPLYIWIIFGFFLVGSLIAYPAFAKEFIPIVMVCGGLVLRALLYRYLSRYFYSRRMGNNGTQNLRGGNFYSSHGWSQFIGGIGWQVYGFGNYNAGNRGNFYKTSNQRSSYYQSASSFYNQFRNWHGFTQKRDIHGKSPYEILGVSENASISEIKKAYREKMKKYHPDVIEKLHPDPDYRKECEEKAREINMAYNILGGK